MLRICAKECAIELLISRDQVTLAFQGKRQIKTIVNGMPIARAPVRKHASQRSGSGFKMGRILLKLAYSSSACRGCKDPCRTLLHKTLPTSTTKISGARGTHLPIAAQVQQSFRAIRISLIYQPLYCDARIHDEVHRLSRSSRIKAALSGALGNSRAILARKRRSLGKTSLISASPNLPTVFVSEDT